MLLSGADYSEFELWGDGSDKKRKFQFMKSGS